MRYAITTALWVLRLPIPMHHKREEFHRVLHQWNVVRPLVVQRRRTVARYTPSSPSFACRDYTLEALRRRAIGNAAFKVMWSMRRQEQAILRLMPPAMRPAVSSLIAADMTRHQMRQAIADRTWPLPVERQPKRPPIVIDAEAVEVHLLPKPR